MIFALFCISSGQTITWNELESRTKKEVYQKYQDLFVWEKKDSYCHTGGNDGCEDLGTHAQWDIDGAFKRLNFFRYLTGLKPLVMSNDSSLINEEMQACNVLHKQDLIQHELNKDWKCYTKSAARAALNSDIYYFKGGACSAESIEGYMRDYGVDDLGHRRWLLYPHLHEFATGTYGKVSAVRVINFNTPHEEKELPPFIAYPSPGYFPSRFMANTWSFSGVMSNKGSSPNQMPKDTEASIVCDNKNISFDKVIDEQNSAMYPGYVRMTIKGELPQVGSKCTVVISSASMNTTWTYTVKSFDAEYFNPDEPEKTADPVITAPPEKTVEPTIDPTTTMSTYCVGNKKQCGDNLVDTSSIESYLQKTKMTDILIEIRASMSSIPLNQFLQHNVKVIGITSNQKPYVTFKKSGSPKKNTSQIIENIDFATVIDVSFENLTVLKTKFLSIITLKSNILTFDFPSLQNLIIKTAKIKTKLLNVKVDFVPIISFEPKKIIIAKKNTTGKLLDNSTVEISDSNATNVTIVSTKPVILKIERESMPNKLKPVVIDITGSSKKTVEFDGPWSLIDNYRDSITVISGGSSVEYGHTNDLQLGEKSSSPKDRKSVV